MTTQADRDIVDLRQQIEVERQRVNSFQKSLRQMTKDIEELNSFLRRWFPNFDQKNCSYCGARIHKLSHSCPNCERNLPDEAA